MRDIVSIIVPIYNGEQYLTRCIESVYAQTYNDWELILVDDGSTDATAAIARKQALNDIRIRFIQQKNQGVSVARNAGMAAASGTYLTFVDSDDWLEPYYLETLLYALQNAQGAQLAICGVYEEWGWNEGLLEGGFSVDEIRRTPSRYTNPLYINALWNKLFLRDVVEKWNIRFPVSVHRCEDAYFVRNYLLYCQKVTVTAKKAYHYVQRNGSAMHSFYAPICDDELPLMYLQYEFFHAQELSWAEEAAFWRWQYGKVLEILRHIIFYAPTKQESIVLISRFCQNSIVCQSITRPMAELGHRKGVYSFLVQNKQYSLLYHLMRSLEQTPIRDANCEN